MLVADHPPRCGVRVAAVAGIGVNALLRQLDQPRKPWLVLEREERIVGRDEVHRQRRKAGGDKRPIGDQRPLELRKDIPVGAERQRAGIAVFRHDAVDEGTEESAFGVGKCVRCHCGMRVHGWARMMACRGGGDTRHFRMPMADGAG